MTRVRRLASAALLLIFASVASAQDLASIEKRVTLTKLDNGLTIIVDARSTSVPSRSGMQWS